MKKLCCSLIVLACLSTNGFAFEPLGPSVPVLKTNQAGIALEYTWSKLDIEAEGLTEFGLDSWVIKDSKMNKVQAKLAVSVTEDLELFFRSGIGNLKGESGDRSDEGLLLGGGFKIALIRDAAFDLGITAQTGWGKFNFGPDAFTIDGVAVSWEEQVSFHEIQVATGPVVKLAENVTLYGGPFLHFITGRDEIKGTIEGFDVEDELRLEQDDIFGGYIGTLIQLGARADVAVEFQATGSGEGLAASLQYRF